MKDENNFCVSLCHLRFMTITLSTPVSELTRVGKTTESRLKRLGIEQAQDLLFYYPFRYDDFSKILTIKELRPDQNATIKARIEIIANKRSSVKKKLITEALVADSTGQLKIIWFNQAYLTKVLKPGDWVYLAGRVDYDMWNIQLANPSYEKIETWKKDATHTGRLVPIYSVTGNLTQKQIRFLAKLVQPLAKQIKDFLPQEIKQELQLIDWPNALNQIHFPDSQVKLAQAEFRLKFDELFLIQLKTQKAKQELKKFKAPQIQFKEKETKAFVDSLPFKLTIAQRKSAWEIIKDLEKETPMNRLLEGDVGSGKTVVAVIASLNVIWNDYQTILMAPTEILAKQHFETISKLLKKTKIKAGLMTRTDKKTNSQKKKDKDLTKLELVEKISSGELNLIIGTHALIQEDVNFKKLGLVIIDEQHRFGVEQRKKLKEKSNNKTIEQYSNESSPTNGANPAKRTERPPTPAAPHFLSMTATPIPRSLALTIYGDLDLSIINEMPLGRKKVITKIVSPGDRPKAYEFIRGQIEASRQVFVICPLIDESDKLGVKAATAEHEKIDKEIFPHFKVGLLHGRLKTKEKEQVRYDFWRGRLNILVSTSVVEVGVDVPNATVMMIEGAERFGLAQLYQFRGRVGRSGHQSFCFLFTDSNSLKTKKRLEALITAKNGFELAEKDLEIRGPGELYGTNQSGFLGSLKIAKLTDYDIIKLTKQWAEKLIAKDPNLFQYPLLREKIESFEKEALHLE